MSFFKNDPRPRGIPKQVFLTYCEPVAARVGPPEIHKCLESGRFRTKMDQKSVKNALFPKHLGPIQV